ncbi:MAG: hypothetical protein JW741_23825 [Sedimentisphaerales bacterium]|nr:hypothetical protein [Sedimentisphaerales bacterium]
MNSYTVLLLGHHARQDLAEMLCGIGLEPEVRGSVPGALERLRWGHPAAVLIDRRFTRADALEFVLNVRDIEPTVPVIVIGTANDKAVDRQIHEQRYTVVIEETKDMDALSGELMEVLDRFKDLRQRDNGQRVTSSSSKTTRIPSNGENELSDSGLQ